MNVKKSEESLDRQQDIVRLAPHIVERFYADFNRLGQRPADSTANTGNQPERWIGSSTKVSCTKPEDSTGLSTCPDLENITLKALLADQQTGPRLLGEERFTKHKGSFRVLIKLLDALSPIPLHVHANDAYIQKNPETYPGEQFGKDEAYHFLDSSKGPCAYTHLGLHHGVDAKTLIAAMRKGTDHVVELSPVAPQIFGEGYMVKAGLLHRPGTALTLEIQQPSDVYALFQTDILNKPISVDILHPGFESIEAAAETIVEWEVNANPKLLANNRLRPTKASGFAQEGGKTEWIFPPGASTKFSGLRVTVESTVTLKVNQPMVLYVWKGKGTLNGRPIDGRGGPAGNSDEFFIGVSAAKAGLELTNSGDTPLVAFAMFAQSI